MMKLPKIKRRSFNRSVGGDVGINIILFVFGAFMFLPMVYAISQSLKPLDELWMFPPRFLVINPTHLNEHGIRYFCALSNEFVLITSNQNHPAFQVKEDNLHILYQPELCLPKALEILYEQYGCERLTIQTGGTLNALFLREKLIDFVDIVVAPILIGGKDTSTVVDGQALTSNSQLSQLGVLELQECTVLKDSYLRLRYKVIS